MFLLLTLEPEQCVKSIQIDHIPVFLLLTLNKFHIFFWCFHVEFEQANADWESIK